MLNFRTAGITRLRQSLDRLKLIVLSAVSLTLLFAPGCKPGANLGSNVLAKVDGEIITVDDYKAMNVELPKELKDREQALNMMINNMLIARMAHSEQLFGDPDVTAQLDEFNSRQLPVILEKDIARQIVVTDEELAREFNKPAPVMEVSVITTSNLSDAQAAKAELDKGTPFEKVLDKYSIFKADIKKDISLDDHMYPVGVRAMLNSMQPGSISPVAKIEIGYSIFRLNAKKSSDQLWESMKEQKRTELKERKTKEAMDELIKKLWSEADIKTNEKLFQPGGDKSWGARVDGVTISIAPGMLEGTGDPHAPHQGMKPASIMSSVNKMINRYLLAKEAKRRGLLKDPAYQRMLRFASEEALAQVYIAKVRGDYVVTDADIQDYYDKNKDKLMTKKAYRLSRILLKNEADANKALSLVKSGKDFAAVAREMSEDESTKARGGDVGIIVPDGLKEPLKSAISKLKVGEVAGPLRSGYGFEILKATDMREPAMPPLADVKESIRKRVLLTKRSERIEKFYKELSQKADVKINTRLLKSL